jgi:DNA-directed RNA polymerase specialized sigma24 family protein
MFRKVPAAPVEVMRLRYDQHPVGDGVTTGATQNLCPIRQKQSAENCDNGSMNSMDENDGALLARHARGDAEAFELLYRRHEMRTWRYLERNAGHRATADELLQEVWFAVSKDAVGFEAKMRFSAWLFGIASKRMAESTVTSAEPEGAPTGVPDQVAALTRAVGQLPRDLREAFLLHMEGELTIIEIAAITNSSIETIKTRLHLARTKLLEQLSE